MFADSFAMVLSCFYPVSFSPPVPDSLDHQMFKPFNRASPREEARRTMPTSQAKPFDIEKQLVWEACKAVAANKGAPGVDEVKRLR